MTGKKHLWERITNQFHLANFTARTMLVDIPLTIVGGYVFVLYIIRFFSKLTTTEAINSISVVDYFILAGTIGLDLVAGFRRQKKYAGVSELYDNLYVDISYWVFSFSAVVLVVLVVSNIFPFISSQYPSLLTMMLDTYVNQIPEGLRILIGSPVIYYFYALFFDDWSYIKMVVRQDKWDKRFGNIFLTQKKIKGNLDLGRMIDVIYQKSEIEKKLVNFELAKSGQAFLLREIKEHHPSLYKLYLIDKDGFLNIINSSHLNEKEFLERAREILS